MSESKMPEKELPEAIWVNHRLYPKISRYYTEPESGTSLFIRADHAQSHLESQGLIVLTREEVENMPCDCIIVASLMLDEDYTCPRCQLLSRATQPTKKD